MIKGRFLFPLNRNSNRFYGILLRFFWIIFFHSFPYMRHIIIFIHFSYDKWKKNLKLIPLGSSFSNYRPINILSTWSKAFKWILYDQNMMCNISGSGLMYDYQSSFWRGHTTTNSLVKIDMNRSSWSL